jgi:hypothetical protein
MDLKQRLNTLRGQSGKRATTATFETLKASETLSGCTLPGDDLMQRLSRMQHARRHMPPKREPLDDATLARLVGGRVVAEGLLLVERQSPLPHAGLMDLQRCLTGLPESRGLSVPDWAFIDTETTGLAGGTGTVAFMLGLARVEGGVLTVRQYLLSRFAGERVMLEQALDWLGELTGLVSYNGKTFDLPLLKTRTRLAGLPPAAWERPHLDLLYGVRRCFERYWPDCRLATAEVRLLGLERENDLPGSEAPAAWLACLQRGDASRIPGVLDHNRQDLRSLARLLPVLAEVQRGESDQRGHPGRIARAWLRQGEVLQARRLLELTPALLNRRERLLLASLYYRTGDRDAALAILEELAGEGSTEAIEQLAKHHEHFTRDLPQAVRYAQALPDSTGREHRLIRLGEKQGRNIEFPF